MSSPTSFSQLLLPSQIKIQNRVPKPSAKLVKSTAKRIKGGEPKPKIEKGESIKGSKWRLDFVDVPVTAVKELYREVESVFPGRFRH